jgi:hypothetical protein
MRDILLLIAWFYGIMLSSGGLFFLAVLFPPYAWYVVCEHFFRLYGLI